MNELTSENSSITATIINDVDRLPYVEKLFGLYFPLAIEPAVYTVTEKMAPDYRGGFWNFFKLSNSGFFMAEDSERLYQVTSLNQYQCELSAQGCGIVSCLTAFSHLSFSRNEQLGRLCSTHFHLLRDYMFEVPEADLILRLID
jgi:hypothetical protein